MKTKQRHNVEESLQPFTYAQLASLVIKVARYLKSNHN